MAKPTTTFRWYVQKNEVTAAQVKSESLMSNESMMECKKRLVGESTPVLQQWHEAEGWEHPDYVRAGGLWEDVPTVVEMRPAA